MDEYNDIFHSGGISRNDYRKSITKIRKIKIDTFVLMDTRTPGRQIKYTLNVTHSNRLRFYLSTKRTDNLIFGGGSSAALRSVEGDQLSAGGGNRAADGLVTDDVTEFFSSLNFFFSPSLSGDAVPTAVREPRRRSVGNPKTRNNNEINRGRGIRYYDAT